MNVLNNFKSIAKSIMLIVLVNGVFFNLCEAKGSRGSSGRSVASKSVSASKPNIGRTGKQARLKELVNDKSLSSANKGWLKQEINAVKSGNRKTIRVPPGTELAHFRGFEANKGFGYKYSTLNEKALHRAQHKIDANGKKQSHMWTKKSWGF